MVNKNIFIFKTFVFLAIFALFVQSCTTKAVVYEFSYKNPSISFEQRVDNLVSLMTLDEKISQMVNESPAIPRLGIPAYNWWNETLHGVARSPYNVTSYPQAIGLAAGWNPESLGIMASYCAEEGRAIFNDSRAKGKSGIYLGLTYWTPNINIFRDPRWGRGQETYGEDPYLTGTLGKAFVKGLEGNHPKYMKASACAKHFAVHSGPEWNRSTFDAKVSNYDLWNTYLPAFKDLIVDAKVSGVMCAYNALDGQPCCANDRLMNSILRDKWKFSGYVTSDCGGINHLWKTHKTHPSKESAAADAVLHGTDCECSGDPAYKALHKAIAENKITEEQINVSVKRLFMIRFRLGMFDSADIVPFSHIGLSSLETKNHKKHALKMAQESMVLLKNENNILPLSKKIKKIAVVGPNADDASTLLSNYYGYPSKLTTVLEGIQNKISGEVIYEKGVNLIDNSVFKSQYNPSLFSYNGQQGFYAEYFKNTKFEGKPQITRIDKKINYQWGDGEKVADEIIANTISIRWTTNYTADKSEEISLELKGDDRCRLFVDGEKRIETDLKNGYYTFNAEKGRQYKLVIEYMQYSDNAEIKLDIGKIEQATPEIIAQRVQDADAIVFVGGISAKLEGEAMPVTIPGFKGGDRTNIELPAVQTTLLKALKETKKPIIFVNMSGGAMGFEWEATNIPAIIQAWYPGQDGGQAVADVLFGDYNPAGRLPVTFYKNVNDLPDFENYDMENRTYRYFKGETLYPFGYGLSYTTFNYSNLEVVQTNSDEVKISVDVTNAGKYRGDEVVQVYVSEIKENSSAAIRSLKNFKRINLSSGEVKRLDFIINTEDLFEIDETGNAQQSKEEILIAVGGMQPDEKSNKNRSTVQKKIIIK